MTLGKVTTGNSKFAESRIFAEGRISGCRRRDSSPSAPLGKETLSVKPLFAESTPLGTEERSAKRISPTVERSVKTGCRQRMTPWSETSLGCFLRRELQGALGEYAYFAERFVGPLGKGAFAQSFMLLSANYFFFFCPEIFLLLFPLIFGHNNESRAIFIKYSYISCISFVSLNFSDNCIYELHVHEIIGFYAR